MKELSQQLTLGAKALNLQISDQQIDDLITLIEQLQKWNKAYNLTAIVEPEKSLKLHILDSLAVIPFIKQNNIIDIGTGPGFPGLPLAIMLPQVQFTLLDSNSKKVRFIRQVIHTLKLNNVEAVHSRVEDYQAKTYSIVISRAFASINDMIAMTKHLLSVDGSWLAMKGQYNKEDVDCEQLNIKEVACSNLNIPGLNAERCLIEFKPLDLL